MPLPDVTIGDVGGGCRGWKIARRNPKMCRAGRSGAVSGCRGRKIVKKNPVKVEIWVEKFLNFSTQILLAEKTAEFVKK